MFAFRFHKCDVRNPNAYWIDKAVGQRGVVPVFNRVRVDGPLDYNLNSVKSSGGVTVGRTSRLAIAILGCRMVIYDKSMGNTGNEYFHFELKENKFFFHTDKTDQHYRYIRREIDEVCSATKPEIQEIQAVSQDAANEAAENNYRQVVEPRINSLSGQFLIYAILAAVAVVALVMWNMHMVVGQRQMMEGQNQILLEMKSQREAEQAEREKLRAENKKGLSEMGEWVNAKFQQSEINHKKDIEDLKDLILKLHGHGDGNRLPPSSEWGSPSSINTIESPKTTKRYSGTPIASNTDAAAPPPRDTPPVDTLTWFFDGLFWIGKWLTVIKIFFIWILPVIVAILFPILSWFKHDWIPRVQRRMA